MNGRFLILMFLNLVLCSSIYGINNAKDSSNQPISIIENSKMSAYNYLKDSSKAFTFGCGNGGIHQQEANLSQYLSSTKSYDLLERLLDSANIYGQLYAAYELLQLDVANIYEFNENVILKIKLIINKKQKIRYCSGCFLRIRNISWVAKEHSFSKLLRKATRK